MKYTSLIIKCIIINIFQFHGIPWNSPEVPGNSRGFHGTFLGDKGGSMEFHITVKYDIAEFHGNPLNFRNSPFSLTSGSLALTWNIPCNSMQLCHQFRCNQIPWNLVIARLSDILFPWNSMLYVICLNYHFISIPSISHIFDSFITIAPTVMRLPL